jgi:cytochrome c553
MKMRVASLLLGMALVSAPIMAQAQAPLLAQACAGCHGQNGAGLGGTPKISGTPPAEFIQNWAQLRANEKPVTIMGRIARGYTDAEVAALADYFASLR